MEKFNKVAISLLSLAGLGTAGYFVVKSIKNKKSAKGKITQPAKRETVEEEDENKSTLIHRKRAMEKLQLLKDKKTITRNDLISVFRDPDFFNGNEDHVFDAESHYNLIFPEEYNDVVIFENRYYTWKLYYENGINTYIRIDNKSKKVTFVTKFCTLHYIKGKLPDMEVNREYVNVYSFDELVDKMIESTVPECYISELIGYMHCVASDDYNQHRTTKSDNKYLSDEQLIDHSKEK
jgi:hypothetical protein